MSSRLRPVLAAEDEQSDALILRLAFQKAQIPNPLVIVSDGEEAVDYLTQCGADRSVQPLPVLILLDLKMPRMSGFDVLTRLLEEPKFKSIPAVVLSSSSDESDIQRSKQLGAREYFVKPHQFPELLTIVRQLQARWLTHNSGDCNDTNDSMAQPERG